MATIMRESDRGRGDRVGSEILDRQPPHSLEAERAVLGSILLLPEVSDEVSLLLRTDDFYDQAHQRIFGHLMALYNAKQRVDHRLLIEKLKSAGQFEAVGGAAYIAEVAQAVPTAAHAQEYAEIVRDKALVRMLIHASTDILRDAYDETAEPRSMLGEAEARVFAILNRTSRGEVASISDVLQQSLLRLDARMKHDHALSGIETGFVDFDDLTGGLHESELVILAARPSMGKTALVCNFALSIAREERQGVLLFSLEQSKLELAERFLCIQARIDGHKLRQGDLDEVEQHSLHEASNEMREFPLYIDDTAGRTVSQIAAVSRRLKRRFGIGIVIVDYLQLIESDDRNLPREQQISTITRRLKFLAKDLKIPVMALAQLNRGVEQREDKRPRLADLRESGAIEQDADIVMFLHRPEAYDPEDRPGEADLIISKNRNGPIGNVPLVWLKEQLRFGDRAPDGVSDALHF